MEALTLQRHQNNSTQHLHSCDLAITKTGKRTGEIQV